MDMITCIAPVNIALIKYWGKRNEELILPLNDSISTSLAVEYMHAKTTALISSSLKEDRFWLNGLEEPITTPRLLNCLQAIRKRASGSEKNWHVHICSENNFPTAAGLASSAAGYACLVYTLTKLYKIDGDISEIARLGSGSACRSVFGGFVQWYKGVKEDGSDSVAQQIAPESHWPELRILILVVNNKKKSTSSSSGMQQSVKTSDLLKYRVDQCVPCRMTELKKAIQEKNFENLAEVTMKDSNQMHAVCLDTFPPVAYMTDISHAVIKMVHLYNKACGSTKVAYTFDAGPNACLYMLEQEVPTVLSLINKIFPPNDLSENYIRGMPVDSLNQLPRDILSMVPMESYESGSLKYIIHTKIGSGPQVVNDIKQHLLTNDGFPVKLL